MLFRPQKITVLEDGAVMAADDGDGRALRQRRGLRLARRAAGAEPDPAQHGRSRCARRRTTRRPTGRRSDRFDLAVSLNRGQPALARAVPRARALDRAFHRARTCASSRCAPSTMRAGRGTSGSMPRRAPCSTTCTTASRSTRRASDGCCACSGSSSPIPATCGRRSPASPCTSGWRWTTRSRLRLKPQNLLLNLPLARPQ